MTPAAAFKPTNQVDLISVKDSRILTVNLYAGRAEITRLYKFTVKTGQNLVNINGLPNTLDRDSLRVEGKGSATIHDVTISNMPSQTYPELEGPDERQVKEEKLLQARLERCKKGLSALETYIGSLNVQHTDSAQLAPILEHYDEAGEALNVKSIELEEKIKSLQSEAQRKSLGDAWDALFANQLELGPNKLGLKASISVFAASEGEVAIILTYAVQDANWTAGYDIRVDMDAKQKPVRLVYKAVITQNTGESWDDVELNLETAAPTFGGSLPTLPLQKLTLDKPQAPVHRSLGLTAIPCSVTSMSQPFAATKACDWLDDGPSLGHRDLAVTSKGNVNATFRVPGLSTLPSDGISHNVTIVQLDLDATMSWVAIPKVDIKTHLQAKIKNASDYTFLPGTASIYVDGSFIARTQVPLVSPQESFDCSLGLDPSIRITYHPQNKKVSQSGLLSRTSSHVVTQRITVFNSKTTAVNRVKIIDQVPVSEIPNATPKLISPALNRPELSFDQPKKMPAFVKVGDGVVAQWEGADEPGFDVDALGADGKFYWMCAIPAREKVNLALQWEIAAPAGAPINGM